MYKKYIIFSHIFKTILCTFHNFILNDNDYHFHSNKFDIMSLVIDNDYQYQCCASSVKNKIVSSLQLFLKCCII